jgi:hypothetical protein
MDKNFGGVIWTNHALQRLSQRNIRQSDAWATWRHSDQSRYASTRGAWIYYKTYRSQRIEVVAKKDDVGKWIILSVWSRPVYEKHTTSKRKESLIIKILKKIFGVK